MNEYEQILAKQQAYAADQCRDASIGSILGQTAYNGQLNAAKQSKPRPEIERFIARVENLASSVSSQAFDLARLNDRYFGTMPETANESVGAPLADSTIGRLEAVTNDLERQVARLVEATQRTITIA